MQNSGRKKRRKKIPAPGLKYFRWLNKYSKLELLNKKNYEIDYTNFARVFNKVFGRESENHFSLRDVLNSKGILLENTREGKARLVNKAEDVREIFQNHITMSNSKLEKQNFEMLYWDFFEEQGYSCFLRDEQIVLENLTFLPDVEEGVTELLEKVRRKFPLTLDELSFLKIKLPLDEYLALLDELS